MRKCFPDFQGIQIFPQGGKRKVIEHALAEHAEYEGVRRIYIVDKDFDDLLDSVVRLDSLFYLDQYGIENLLIDEDALVELCVQEFPKLQRADVKAGVDFDTVIQRWSLPLDRLHRAFLLVQKFSLGLPNTGSSVENFVYRDRRCTIDQRLINSYVDSVFNKLSELGVVGCREAFENEMDRAFTTNGLVNVNGKFVLHLLYHHVKRLGLCGHVKGHSFAYRIAGACGLGRFSSFIRAVREYIGRDCAAEQLEHAN